MANRNGTLIQWNGDGKPSSIGNIGFTYDGLGERIKKVSGGQTTLYPFTDYEIAHDGTTTKSLVGGKQVCGTSGCEFFMYHRDHLGSVQSITDASGEVLHKKYKPFGDTHSTVGPHSDLRGWIGEREEETELVYLNARYYDPEIGRFISPDPIARVGQKLNRYTYSRNNPINFLDPSGLDDAGVWWYYESDAGGSMFYGHVYVEVTSCLDCLAPGVYVDPVVPDMGVDPIIPIPVDVGGEVPNEPEGGGTGGGVVVDSGDNVVGGDEVVVNDDTDDDTDDSVEDGSNSDCQTVLGCDSANKLPGLVTEAVKTRAIVYGVPHATAVVVTPVVSVAAAPYVLGAEAIPAVPTVSAMSETVSHLSLAVEEGVVWAQQSSPWWVRGLWGAAEGLMPGPPDITTQVGFWRTIGYSAAWAGQYAPAVWDWATK
jgi:RHS repeat-associated protein